MNLEWYPAITLLPPLSLSWPVRSLPALGAYESGGFSSLRSVSGFAGVAAGSESMTPIRD